MAFKHRFMRTAAAVLTAAAVTVLLPVSASAEVVEGRHAVDPASLNAAETYGPGVSGAAGMGSLAERLGLPSTECPAGLELDLWEETLSNLERCTEVTQQNLEAVNALRASVGRAPLTIDPQLSAAAAYRAAQIRKYRHMSHYGAAGEFLAYEVAKTVCGTEDLFLFENYYFEYSDAVRASLSDFRARKELRTAGGGGAGNGTSGSTVQSAGPDQAAADAASEAAVQAAWQQAVAEDMYFFAEDGQAWLTASPVHYENLTRADVTRIGIGFSFSPENELILDTMVQLFR